MIHSPLFPMLELSRSANYASVMLEEHIDPTFTPTKAHFPCSWGLAFQSGGRCDLQIFIFLNGASL